jgi:hypothetical protein
MCPIPGLYLSVILSLRRIWRAVDVLFEAIGIEVPHADAGGFVFAVQH